ncbi:MAG TPA: cytochrome C, partial [Desulfovibrio sp.]|nr:cytochrome C [Desulfovibrio sp.]
DHSRHPALQQPFATPQEVTKACLSCHNAAAQQVHKTIHWTWLDPADPERKMGKGGITFNNFCIAIPSNEPRCTSCHAGFGWKNAQFD